MVQVFDEPVIISIKSLVHSIREDGGNLEQITKRDSTVSLKNTVMNHDQQI